MSILEGSIDHLGRPIINVDIPDAGVSETPMRCLVDTGFNRSLFINQANAREFGFKPHLPQIVGPVRTAAVGTVAAELWRGEIVWLGDRIAVDAHTVPYYNPAGGADDAPHALLGVELLRGLHVFLDFQFGRLTIQRPYPPRS